MHTHCVPRAAAADTKIEGHACSPEELIDSGAEAWGRAGGMVLGTWLLRGEGGCEPMSQASSSSFSSLMGEGGACCATCCIRRALPARIWEWPDILAVCSCAACRAVWQSAHQPETLRLRLRTHGRLVELPDITHRMCLHT